MEMPEEQTSKKLLKGNSCTIASPKWRVTHYAILVLVIAVIAVTTVLVLAITTDIFHHGSSTKEETGETQQKESNDDSQQQRDEEKIEPKPGNSSAQIVHSSSSWAQLEISTNVLVSMPYGGFRVKIYEQASNHKTTTQVRDCKYFYMPVTILNHQSAVSSINNSTKQPEVNFRIEMWNNEVERLVVNYLTEYLSQPIKANQVQVIPVENVALASTIPSTVFSLPTDWLLYQQYESVKFTLSCFVQKDCDQLAADMRSNPQQFDHFKLLFSLSSQSTQTRQTVIRIENILSGQMMTKLMQKFNETTKDALLTASDEKKLLTESTTNVLIDTFDDSNVVAQNSESHVYKMMENLLVSSRTIIKDQTDKMWDSVFWNEDNYRPDKTTKTLNDIYNKLNTEDQKKFLDSFQNTDTIDLSVEGGFKGFFSLDTKFKKELASHGLTTKEDINKLFQESKDHGEWDGEKFVPKPLKLSRINLSKLRDTQSFRDRKVSVKYSTAVLSTPINFQQNSNISTNDVNVTFAKIKRDTANLKNELNGTIKRTRAIVDPSVADQMYIRQE